MSERVSSFLGLFVLFNAAAISGWAGAVVYPNFFNPTGLYLGGNAGLVNTSDGAVLRLTPAQLLQAGSAFSTTRIALNRFSTYFQFRITDTGYLAADGLVFVVQGAAFGVGEAGGQEGYGGLPSSVAVEFDTIKNQWDPNDNHVAILMNGDVTQFLGTGAYSPSTHLANGDLWSVWIDYDGTTLEVRLADGSNIRPAAAAVSAQLNIAGIVGQPSGYLGFTAGTGSYSEDHDIITWQFNDGCVVTLGSASASFGAAGGSGSVAVGAPSGCSWPVLTSASWIHPSTGVGTGNATLAFSVDANTDNARSSILQIGGLAFSVSEASAPVSNLPRINSGGVADPWTYTPGLSPGAWVSIFGSNLANTTQSWSPLPGQPLPTVLGGVAVTIDGIASPLAYVSPGLINALTPSGVRQGPVSIVVYNGGLPGSSFSAQSTGILPAIYCNPVAGTSPVRYLVTAVEPVSGELLGSISVDSRVSRAVRRGDTIDLYAVGLGPSSPQFPTTNAFSDDYAVTADIVVMLGNSLITPSFADLVAPGLYQIRITVPADTPAGDQPITLEFSVGQSASNVFLTIE